MCMSVNSCTVSIVVTRAHRHHPLLLALSYSLLSSYSPKDSETHFKVVVVSSRFDNVKSLVARHRMVNDALSDLFQDKSSSTADSNNAGIHALSIVAKTPKQWQAMIDNGTAAEIEPSPNCRGGDGTLPPKKKQQR